MATRTISNTGGNWNSTGTWVEGVVPVAADAVVATATSGQLTINVTTAVCTTMILTNYVNTLTISSGQILQVNSTLTLVAGMTYAGTGKLKLGTTSATITSGGKTITGDLEIIGSGTKTLSGAWIVNGLFSTSGSSATTFNGSTLRLNGGMSLAQNVLGTTTATLAGGTLSSSAEFAGWGLTTSYAGNMTIDDWGLVGGTHTYTSGTITHTATKTLRLCGGNACTPTINWSTNIRVQNMKLETRATFTMTSTLYVDGDLDMNNGGIFSINSGNLNLSGSVIQSGTGVVSLFCTSGMLNMVGTGSICTLTNWGQITINTSGTITFPSTAVMVVGYSSAPRTCITYTAGTVVVETGHQLRFSADATYINSGAIVWDNVFFGSTGSGSALTYITGDFKCNYLHLAPLSPSSSIFPINTPIDRSGSSTVLIYDTKTITVYTAFYTYKGRATSVIRSNTGTGTINYLGTIENMDINNCTFGSALSGRILNSTNRLYVFNGTLSGITNNIFLVRSIDLLDSPLSITHL